MCILEGKFGCKGGLCNHLPSRSFKCLGSLEVKWQNPRESSCCQSPIRKSSEGGWSLLGCC